MRVLVTGASRGIGRAICERLARDAAAKGEDIAIAACASRHPDELDDVIGGLRALGATAEPLLGDLADPALPETLVAGAAAALGGLDALVSNAGVSPPVPLLDCTLEQWDWFFAVNLRPTWLLAKAAHPHLKASGRGRIVTIGSMSGIAPQPGLGPYSASKAALIMLTRQMAQEWAADGIRANCVSPGMVVTPMTAANYEDHDFRARREAMIPAGRIASPEDIAGAVAFMLSRDAGYVTGQNLAVDGGITDAILKVLPGRKK